MSELTEKALKAAEELAEEASGNGNDWYAWCAPRLEIIRDALSTADSASADMTDKS